jgi:hypothetical protein
MEPLIGTPLPLIDDREDLMMTTVAIVPVVDAQGEKAYRAMAGDKRSMGKTAGQALDALTAQLEYAEVGGLLFIQGFQPDAWFTATQQQRLAELMEGWRAARNRGEPFPPDQQAELERLVKAELTAAQRRTLALLPT